MALETALQAVETHKQFKDIAMFIKQAFDRKFPSTTSTEGVFHAVVGTHFAGRSPQVPVRSWDPRPVTNITSFIPLFFCDRSNGDARDAWVHPHPD